jgi:hypothetical protein
MVTKRGMEFVCDTRSSICKIKQVRKPRNMETKVQGKQGIMNHEKRKLRVVKTKRYYNIEF